MGMARRKIVHEYMISESFWMEIEPLLPHYLSQKRSPRDLEWMKENIIVFSIFYLTTANGNLYQNYYGTPNTVHDRFQE